MPTTDLTRELTRRLLEWTNRNLPDFPWRRGGDPYAVWVAVVMLQQTQMATVLPYYERFIRAFPTVSDLAAAELDQVLKAWEGMGYYARARNLHAAARVLAEHYRNALPSVRSLLLALPGIGDYTAGAILSIAFGADEPAVDGNVRRVVSRLFAVDGDPRRAATKRTILQLASRLLPPGEAGDFNQGLMEFGATICTARQPRCDDCPLGDLCEARRQGRQDELPLRLPRRAVPHYDVAAAVVRNPGDQLLIVQRRESDMLGGLWGFPSGRCEKGEDLRTCALTKIEEQLSLVIGLGKRVAVVQHAYSHFRMTLHAYDGCILGGEPQTTHYAAWKWVSLDELDALPLSVADQAIVTALRR